MRLLRERILTHFPVQRLRNWPGLATGQPRREYSRCPFMTKTPWMMFNWCSIPFSTCLVQMILMNDFSFQFRTEIEIEEISAWPKECWIVESSALNNQLNSFQSLTLFHCSQHGEHAREEWQLRDAQHSQCCHPRAAGRWAAQRGERCDHEGERRPRQAGLHQEAVRDPQGEEEEQTGGARGGEETQGELLQKSHRHVLDFPNIKYQLLSWTQGLWTYYFLYLHETSSSIN